MWVQSSVLIRLLRHSHDEIAKYYGVPVNPFDIMFQKEALQIKKIISESFMKLTPIILVKLAKKQQMDSYEMQFDRTNLDFQKHPNR